MARCCNYHERPSMDDSPLIENVLLRANDQILKIGACPSSREDTMTIEHVYCRQSQHLGD
jgi:hypothetical protein